MNLKERIRIEPANFGETEGKTILVNIIEPEDTSLFQW
jgi:hypothetical protein